MLELTRQLCRPVPSNDFLDHLVSEDRNVFLFTEVRVLRITWTSQSLSLQMFSLFAYSLIFPIVQSSDYQKYFQTLHERTRTRVGFSDIEVLRKLEESS